MPFVLFNNHETINYMQFFDHSIVRKHDTILLVSIPLHSHAEKFLRLSVCVSVSTIHCPMSPKLFIHKFLFFLKYEEQQTNKQMSFSHLQS